MQRSKGDLCELKVTLASENGFSSILSASQCLYLTKEFNFTIAGLKFIRDTL